MVFADLQPEESISQFLDVLTYLDAVTGHVFDSLTKKVRPARRARACAPSRPGARRPPPPSPGQKKVADNQTRLAALNGRVGVSQALVQKLQAAKNKATVVHSSAKYLGPPKPAAYEPLFSQVGPCRARGARRAAAETQAPPQVPSRLRAIKYGDISDRPDKLPRGPAEWKPEVDRELLLRPPVAAGKPTVDMEEEEGLGPLPPRLPSVTDLLLFNTQVRCPRGAGEVKLSARAPPGQPVQEVHVAGQPHGHPLAQGGGPRPGAPPRPRPGRGARHDHARRHAQLRRQERHQLQASAHQRAAAPGTSRGPSPGLALRQGWRLR